MITMMMVVAMIIIMTTITRETMMPTDVINLLLQVPLVGVFVVFVLIWSDRMAKSQKDRDELMRTFWSEQRENDQAFLVDQRTSDRQIMEKIVESVDKSFQTLNEHDRKTDLAITAMTERTAKKAAGKPAAK